MSDTISRVATRVYLRVGPTGSGHTKFIHDLSKVCNLQLFMKHTITPRKFYRGMGCRKFCKMVDKFKLPKMVAFDNFKTKDMCSHFAVIHNFTTWKHLPKKMDMIVFSVNDKGLKSNGAVDADDVITHVFGEDNGYNSELLKAITEIHHMLPDGTVRILAIGGEKLENALVLTADECMAREVAREQRRGVV
jgi:hypothetical protein